MKEFKIWLEEIECKSFLSQLIESRAILWNEAAGDEGLNAYFDSILGPSAKWMTIVRNIVRSTGVDRSRQDELVTDLVSKLGGKLDPSGRGRDPESVDKTADTMRGLKSSYDTAADQAGKDNYANQIKSLFNRVATTTLQDVIGERKDMPSGEKWYKYGWTLLSTGKVNKNHFDDPAAVLADFNVQFPAGSPDPSPSVKAEYLKSKGYKLIPAGVVSGEDMASGGEGGESADLDKITGSADTRELGPEAEVSAKMEAAALRKGMYDLLKRKLESKRSEGPESHRVQALVLAMMMVQDNLYMKQMTADDLLSHFNEPEMLRIVRQVIGSPDFVPSNKNILRATNEMRCAGVAVISKTNPKLADQLKSTINQPSVCPEILA